MTSALVTGAGGTLGAAVAARLEAAGGRVARHRRGPAPDGGEPPATAGWTFADLAVDDVDGAVARLWDEAENAVGPLDVVVHCASTQEVTPWPSLDAAAWDRVHRAGLRVTTAVTTAALRRLPRGGVLALVGSIEGIRPAPGHAPYAIGKAATHHLVAAAAAEGGPHGIRVVGLAPGLIDRPSLGTDWPEGLDRWNAASALGRPVTAQEVAEVVAFLVSPLASGVTGVTVPVDAGWSAAPGW